VIKKLKKHLDFKYLSLLRDLITKGQYNLTTTSKELEDHPLITTTFYFDGDVLNILYLKNEEFLIEDFPAKLQEHQSKLKQKIETMDVFADHITWLIGMLSMLFSFVVPTDDNPLMQLGVTGAFIAIGLFFKKYIFRFLIAVFRFGAKIYSGKSGKKETGVAS
jgi:hypothetical protein